MHQPFYKDIVRNAYVMPWAYLHATKDYFGMAALAGEFPEVHQTFNLVPSLVLQLEEYARGEARDEMFDLAFKPAADLSHAERAMIVERFFPIPVGTMLEPYPRYFELHERRDPARIQRRGLSRYPGVVDSGMDGRGSPAEGTGSEGTRIQ